MHPTPNNPGTETQPAAACTALEAHSQYNTKALLRSNPQRFLLARASACCEPVDGCECPALNPIIHRCSSPPNAPLTHRSGRTATATRTRRRGCCSGSRPSSSTTCTPTSTSYYYYLTVFSHAYRSSHHHGPTGRCALLGRQLVLAIRCAMPEPRLQVRKQLHRALGRHCRPQPKSAATRPRRPCGHPELRA